MATKLLYSLGLKKPTGHYTGHEDYIDLKTMKYNASLGMKNIIICGDYIKAGGGDYSASNVSAYEIHLKYHEILKLQTLENQEQAIIDILNFFGAKPIGGERFAIIR